MYNYNGALYYPSGKLLYEGTFKDGAIYANDATIYDEDGGVKYKGKFPYS